MPNENIDDQSNSAEVSDDQSAGTQDSSQPTEQAMGQASDSFMNVDLESLTDAEKERFNSMNGVFTQKMQLLADRGRELDAKQNYADLGELVKENPVVNKIVFETIGRIQSGQPVNSPFSNNQPNAQSPAVQDRSPEEIEARKLITDVLQEVMPGLMLPVTEVTRYMQNNQVQSEYGVLCNKYPSAKSVTLQALQNKQMQYRGQDGSMIKLEEAYDLLAGQNPALHTRQAGQPPKQQLAGGALPKARPGVEQSSSGGGAITVPSSAGSVLSKLKSALKRNTEEGSNSFGGATRRAMERFNKEHPRSIP